MRAEDAPHPAPLCFAKGGWVTSMQTALSLCCAVNELVVKFERITGSTYYTIKPEIKGASEVDNPPGERPEGSIPTPPGRDVNVNSSHSNGSYPAANPPMPVVMPTANNSAFHQLLGPRSSQVGPGSQTSSAWQHNWTWLLASASFMTDQ